MNPTVMKSSANRVVGLCSFWRVQKMWMFSLLPSRVKLDALGLLLQHYSEASPLAREFCREPRNRNLAPEDLFR